MKEIEHQNEIEPNNLIQVDYPPPPPPPEAIDIEIEEEDQEEDVQIDQPEYEPK